MPADYLETADVWTVLDLIVAEFQSDPQSTACFDRRLVQRAIALNEQQRLTHAGPELLAACKKVIADGFLDRPSLNACRAAIAKAEGR